jgi:hypothetical protein
MGSKKIQIQVQYCGGWGEFRASRRKSLSLRQWHCFSQFFLHSLSPGYHRYYKGLKEFLFSQLAVSNKIQLIPLEDHGLTGNFEVTVVGSGQVLHSKRNAGQGKAQTPAERMAILEQIQELIEDEMED